MVSAGSDIAWIFFPRPFRCSALLRVPSSSPLMNPKSSLFQDKPDVN